MPSGLQHGVGWDDMRQKKLIRQKELGVVPQQQQLPVVDSFHNQSVMPGLQTEQHSFICQRGMIFRTM